MKRFTRKRETVDLGIILVWPIVASLLSIFLEETGLVHQNFFASIVLFLIVPSLYLSFRAIKYVPKILLVSAIGTVPLMIMVEYIGNISQTWTFPPSVFGLVLFGNVIFEVILWAFFNAYFVIIFYEYFLDKHVTKHLWEPRLKYLVIGLLLAFIVFLLLILSFPVPPIPYFYFLFGLIVFALPVGLQLFYFSETKKLTIKILKASAYFFYLSFLYEIIALEYGYWHFPTESFIGWFSIFGYRFPLEELLWWIMLFAFAILTCYEFFDDDEK